MKRHYPKNILTCIFLYANFMWGALICRCIAEYWDRHKIDTLVPWHFIQDISQKISKVSLAGPQLGVYADSYLAFMKNTPLEKLTRRAPHPIHFRFLFVEKSHGGFCIKMQLSLHFLLPNYGWIQNTLKNIYNMIHCCQISTEN